MALDAAKNTLHGWYKSTVEYVTPINEKSSFNEKGVLTPEEFLKAGCQLVYKCPTWQWEGGDAKKRKPYFPDNQQYLMSRNLPCLRRVKSLMNSAANNEHIVENGEWLNMDENKDNVNDVTQQIADVDLDAIDSKASNDEKTKETTQQPLIQVTDNYVDLDAIDSKASNDDKAQETTQQPLIQVTDNYVAQQPQKSNANANAKAPATADENEDDFVEIPDMEDFDDTDNVVSSAAAAATQTQSQSQAPTQTQKNAAIFSVNESAADNSIVRTRTYDVSITYDKYYAVPRVWLRGYDENGTPLTSSQIFEDISADHAHKTVTVEPHPHSGVVCASIHPCRHSEVMKRFMNKFEETGKQITVDGYLFLFLKFMSAVIPTIQYDFTQSVDSK
eukprot:CAMPEP_0202729996 /NCGR_PEP_ID=MMETSP1385-20130828/186418_1 /ASSEMBLY_ACC=CAM_ASM_000861 /TAXON_ID=933848 /ORGANISM="Elphidium margaritaceum" /LENGTH=388 /DNA_ID=CAMNT_0049396269 /DNA_START=90 /DNA_END=1256 /DNA_ORIENTATION=+